MIGELQVILRTGINCAFLFHSERSVTRSDSDVRSVRISLEASLHCVRLSMTKAQLVTVQSITQNLLKLSVDVKLLGQSAAKPSFAASARVLDTAGTAIPDDYPATRPAHGI